MLYRDEYYCSQCNAGKPCDQSHEGIATLLIRKQRKGPIGQTDLVWVSKYTTFRDMVVGSGREGLDDGGGRKVTPPQEPEIAEEPQMGFGYKTGDGTRKGFPNKPGG
ncbi:unnamed protein product [marine sediment metagenome]|uniref:SF4 helicase domain-containing protein n=1 Tax=marine sediment metagenome TaxID=412755 RepID=X1A4X1_9ZZZZ